MNSYQSSLFQKSVSSNFTRELKNLSDHHILMEDGNIIAFGDPRNAATVMWQDICSKIEKEASVAKLARSALTGFMFENYDLILAQDIKTP